MFPKMAQIMVFTMVTSLFYAFFFFMNLLLVAGPTGNVGDVGYFFSLLCNDAPKAAPKAGPGPDAPSTDMVEKVNPRDLETAAEPERSQAWD
jgi:hypothetical protein